MESLAETTWDAIICGTGLQQSLLALALSRSGKQILHLDPNEYYGGNEAALTLQEAEEWVDQLQKQVGAVEAPVFSKASVSKQAEAGSSLSFSRAYSLALAPFIIHTRSALLSQLVSSRAYRQLEFLAVGAFHVYHPGDQSSATPQLTPIPSTREAIFASTAIQPRPKRALMKFLRFVLDHNAPAQQEKWQSRADDPLEAFLEDEFKLDTELRTLILALTLSLDGAVKVRDGLAVIERHLTSMGMFGPGFAAVYPKWGGGSEIAQVGCRACAVGGGVYMLGTGVKGTRTLEADEDGAKFEVALGTGDVKVKTKMLIRSDDNAAATAAEGTRISRLVAVIDSPLASLFEPIMEGGPNPAVAVVAMPAGTVDDSDNQPAQYPVYVFAHSSETGECPSGQSVLYFTTLATPTSTSVLDKALSSILAALSSADAPKPPASICQLRYEQAHSSRNASVGGEGLVTFPTMPPDLAFTDSALEPVEAAWGKLMASDATEDEPAEYMKFEDREGMGEDED
ncbi:hypothetical protein ACHAQA_006779 [Verticillium albo-atrum]